MKQKKVRQTTSIRIDPEILHKARIEAVKSKMTLGAWLEEAIRETIERDTKYGKKE